ncbi:FG-GAP repeat protein [Marinicella sp. S1101]|uniref:FG-GAP repeat protein n=1 Tax=Marinicella marina TaxID=2996016 RepID=UPI0022608E47|nr:FG-GAP repeat protein [Marinicella marina]MCX7553686.1 FG-GAP repeat protein [Marinicella marina]MDJ1140776.1 FG-GAP repeat protein [Marinicella marina]
MKAQFNMTLIFLLIITSCSWASAPPKGVSSEQWQSIQKQIAASKYHPQPLENGFYTALNAAQGWQVKHAPDGMTTIKNKHIRIGMKLNSIGSQQINGKPEIEIKDNNLYYHHSPTIKEWWVNSADKTEQWFGLKTRPITGSHEIKVGIEIDTNTQVSQEDNQLVFTAENGQKINYDRLKVWDAHGTVLPSRMQLADGSDHFNLIIDDRLATYPITIDPSFSYEHYLKPTVIDESDFFGTSVAISGNYMVIGAPYEDSTSGLINGDSSDNSASATGAAYIFSFDGFNWAQEAYLKASNAEAGVLFGNAVAISGSTVVVGAYRENGDSHSTASTPNSNAIQAGAAYVFTRSGGTWDQAAYLKASNAESFDNFGAAVAIDGGTIVVGSIYEDGDTNSTAENANNNTTRAGAVYVYRGFGENWNLDAYLKASNAESNDYFGNAVAISGNTIVVGAIEEDGDANSMVNAPNNAATEAGAAYVFTRDGSIWSQQAYLKAHNAGAGDEFGNSVAIDDETVVVGAHLEDGDVNSTINSSNNNAIDAGAVYVYIREKNTWTQQAYTKAENTDSEDEFGYAVDIAGNTMIIGAPEEDGNELSTMASPNNFARDAGVSYVFARNGSQWQQKQYLKAARTGPGDNLGESVAINLNHIVISATSEDGDANSTITSPNNDALNAGAVYVYEGSYLIGGQLIGLPFNGSLDLALNGSNLLTLTSNGEYEFPNDVSGTSSYTVSISNTPAGYTCSIVNSAGTLSYDDITDVDVFCSTNSYSVGGSVSGLTGTGLVLRNNGIFDVIINNNGNFTFASELADGTPYEVMVLTQPNDGSTCTVNNGIGIISGSDTSISVVCSGGSYDIGGTVNGLSGTLVLQNNGGDDLTLTNNGGFTFDMPIDDGSAYSVDVSSQPNDQICNISNGSGTVSGADVTDVAVVCVDNTFFIGGSVIGLSAAGLVLQNNGGDDLNIMANGAFTFAEPIIDGSTYSVEVSSQPNDQICTISNGSGTVSGADVTDVAVVCVDNTYFIGGSVNGLSAPGLVLQNNGGDDLNIMSNGGFVFDEPLTNGSNYAVSISAEPNGQACSVSNGAGIVAGDDVIDVMVSCADNTYLLGVNVSGLTGPGLVLQNNGGDNLTITQNGITPFATELSDGDNYNVTIATQPNNPGNTCETVGVSSGVIAGTNRLVIVQCGNDLIYNNGFE